ncbi:DUF5615 family PIN-like protein [candidate division KSB1 bacterium]|nr:DUF5615 family PIN-like protein [candidate division KSB1 bacterium]
MKLLIDENAPRTLVEYLKKENFDLIWIREYHRGLADEEIVRLSKIEDRIIITFDKDFGELVYRKNMNPAGIILLRIVDNILCQNKLLMFLKNYEDKIQGYFSVITEKKIRVRKL